MLSGNLYFYGMKIYDALFFKTARIALVLTLLVILAGSVVRVTQSGMGCPDWPRCFGYYIPPTQETEVFFRPGFSYKSGMMVIERDTLWRANSDFTASTAFDVADWEKYPKHDYATFVVYQTWVEYINRLLGALLGLVILALVLFSFRLRKQRPALVLFSFVLLVLTGFQAWLGKLVVDGNLIPQSISIHMLAALVILWVLLLVLDRNHSAMPGLSNKVVAYLALSLVGISTIQILIGTQVREEIDEIAHVMGYENRAGWIDALSSVFTLHKVFSLVVVSISVFLILQMRQLQNLMFRKLSLAVGSVVGMEIALGFIMSYAEVPRFAQSLHLLFATVLFCVAGRIYLVARKSTTSIEAIE